MSQWWIGGVALVLLGLVRRQWEGDSEGSSSEERAFCVVVISIWRTWRFLRFYLASLLPFGCMKQDCIFIIYTDLLINNPALHLILIATFLEAKIIFLPSFPIFPSPMWVETPLYNAVPYSHTNENDSMTHWWTGIICNVPPEGHCAPPVPRILLYHLVASLCCSLTPLSETKMLFLLRQLVQLAVKI